MKESQPDSFELYFRLADIYLERVTSNTWKVVSFVAKWVLVAVVSRMGIDS
jgi:hypothetical protein